MEGFGGIKNGGHFLSLLSVHQEQVELCWLDFGALLPSQH